MNDLFTLLQELTVLSGVSGDEESIRDYILSHIDGNAEVETDTLGNLLAFKKGKSRPKNKLMFSAHMDEVGLIITAVTDSGLLKFETVGGIEPGVLLGKTVKIVKNGQEGVIAVKAIHLQKEEERKQPVDKSNLYIDIGASCREDALKAATPGDTAVFLSDYTKFGNSFIKAKAIDDRAGCAVMLWMLEQDLSYDTWFAFTVAEEVGLVGAATAAFRIQPDIAVVLESTTAADLPGVTGANRVCELGKGPAISIRDRRTIYDAGLVKAAAETAEKQGIPYQFKQGIFGGNDAGAIHVSREGVRTLAVSVPVRYLHSAGCVANKTDISHTAELAKALVQVLPIS